MIQLLEIEWRNMSLFWFSYDFPDVTSHVWRHQVKIFKVKIVYYKSPGTSPSVINGNKIHKYQFQAILDDSV